jgi:hypothetical protein
MPGMLIQQGAVVMCAHGAPAMPTVPNPSVTLTGAPSCTLPEPWTVTGCPAAAALMPPCVIATWMVGTTRVTSFGQPLLVQSGVSLCTPSGLPLLPVVTQLRVSAM